ncbi:MAG: hypothetical protein AAGA96_19265 [Verrucomicrobiota bacterium]
MSEDSENKKDKLAFGIATGWVIVRHRPYRRNLLFISTLITLLSVFVGAVLLTAFLADRPVIFALYWIACFLLVGFVLLLAVYDLMAIRSEHRKRLNHLEKELADAADEARRIAREELDKEASEKRG